MYLLGKSRLPYSLISQVTDHKLQATDPATSAQILATPRNTAWRVTTSTMNSFLAVSALRPGKW